MTGTRTSPFAKYSTMKALSTIAFLLTGCIPVSAAADDLRAAGGVADALAAAGYVEVRDIEFDDGLWEADVRRADGRWGEVHINPDSGEILDIDSVTSLDVGTIRASLQAAGYTAIDDIDREGATWEADATDARGQRVELRISGVDGSVLHTDVDWDEQATDGLRR